MSGSEQRKDEKSGKRPGVKPARAGSSLTDAVAAALATVDKPAPKTSEPPAAAEAGCASTQATPEKATPDKATPDKATPDKATVEKAGAASDKPAAMPGAPPPAIVAAAVPHAAAPAMVASAAPAKTNGSSFRSGPGSFADLLRRLESGQLAPVAEAKAEDAAKSEAVTPPKPEPIAAAPKKVVAPAAVPAVSKDPVQILYYGTTDVGLVREHNEDNFTVADLAAGVRDNKEPRQGVATGHGIVLAVCDGMGGAAAGEVASQMAVDTIFEVMRSGDGPKDRDDFARRLVRSIEEAGHRIFSAAKMDRTRRGMGTTTTLAGLIDNVLFVGQVGDSRAYVLRGNQFEMITKDQSLVNQLIEAGQLTEEEAEAFEHSNIILQALGTTEEVTVDLTFLELRKGDRLLMCSDGLSGLVHAEMMKEVLQDTKDLPAAAQKLTQMANAGGGHDNITIILAEFDGEGLAAPQGAKVAYQQYPLPPDERAREKSTPPRATSMKAGAHKPGADVKRDDMSPVVTEPLPSSGGSKAWLGVVALVVLLALAVGAYFVLGFGGGGETAGPVTTTPEPIVEVPVEPPVEPPVAPPVEPPVEVVVQDGTVTVATDITGATLFVAEEARGALTQGMTLTLAPGAYDISARRGEEVIARGSVTVEAGGNAPLTLNMPAGVPDPPPEVVRPIRPPTPPGTGRRLPRTNTLPGGTVGGGTARPLGGGVVGGGGGGGRAGGSTPDNPF